MSGRGEVSGAGKGERRSTGVHRQYYTAVCGGWNGVFGRQRVLSFGGVQIAAGLRSFYRLCRLI